MVNLIQDLPTPHNNVLIEQFKSCAEVDIKLWYAQGMDASRYQWESDITQEHFPAEIYGTSFNWSFIKYCLTHSNEKFIIVGWMNVNTLLIHMLFFLLRRPFNHWTDLPNRMVTGLQLTKRLRRWAAYFLLKHSRCRIFGVGKITIDYFRAQGFKDRQLVNLPIFVNVDEELEVYKARRGDVLRRYSVLPNGFFIASGSRLIYEKGYDLLIRAVGLLPADLRTQLKVVIVGSGDALSGLKSLVDNLNLGSCIVFEHWLAIEDFKALIANSDVFIHPARFDSFGGTTLGMALGVPVIGSTGAGAAVDRIEHSENGFLYESEDIQVLADYIRLLYENPAMKRDMGDAARRTAQKWHPRRGVEILLKNAV